MISHKHKFIFVHIPKNAGSTINHELKELCEITKSRKGTLLKERLNVLGEKDYPLAYGKHANDNDMRNLLKDMYGDYFKFCVVRNPWDRLVSIYWYSLGKSIPKNWSFTKFVNNHEKLLRAEAKEDRKEFDRAISWDYDKMLTHINLSEYEQDLRPEEWSSAYDSIVRSTVSHDPVLYNTMKSQCKWIDSSNSKHEQNYHIVRYENLDTDIQNVYRDIGYESNGKLGHKNKRNVSLINKDMVDIHYRDMYSDEDMEVVRVLYRDDIERFGYKF